MAAHTTTPETVSTDTLQSASPLSGSVDGPVHEAANRLVRFHVWGAMGVGLIPFPITDLVGLVAVQSNLLRKLAQLYHVPFRKGVAKNIISSLISSVLPVALTPAIVASIAKAVPVFGQTAGVLTLPILGGASTYALGKVFVQHFASGGTFLTFDPDQVKDYYRRMFEEGKTLAADMAKKSS